MIHDVLVFLKDQLSEFFDTHPSWQASDPGEGGVVLLDGETMNPITFRLGAVTALLINLEEESTLRPADPYRRDSADGEILAVQPEIRLHLYVLFVASFRKYEQCLQALSLIIHYFQNRRVLDDVHLATRVDRLGPLKTELVTLPFSEQKEIWSTLRAPYHPSVLYKISWVAFRDEEGLSLPRVTEPIFEITQ
ncbi:MAG: DUF4255 domain-containing protein [Acidobacteriota bacterium]